jgi:hypothetical protein
MHKCLHSRTSCPNRHSEEYEAQPLQQLLNSVLGCLVNGIKSLAQQAQQ